MNEARIIKTLTDGGSIAAALRTEHSAIEEGLQTLGEAVLAGAEQDVVIGIVAKVEDFCVAHFAHEEQMLRDSGYVDVEPHAAAHGELLRVLHAAHVALGEGQLEATLDVADLLNAFHDHVAQFDRPAHAQVLQQRVECEGGTAQDYIQLDVITRDDSTSLPRAARQ